MKADQFRKIRSLETPPRLFSMTRALALAGCASLALAAPAAWANDKPPTSPAAQDDPAPAQDPKKDSAKDDAEPIPGSDQPEMVITGFRRSIESSIATKRQSSLIVEAISAEDIGKLPDVSIAESLARLPGVAGQRVNGRVQVISIRGLPPDFSNTLLNGREQVSSGDNRAAEFDQYPSELINGVFVYKTSSANLTGQGLAGTVDLRTVRPLQFSDSVVTLNVRGETNDYGSLNADFPSSGYRVSGSFIGQFFDNTLGIAVGYSRLDSPSQLKWQQSWYWGGRGTSLGPLNPDGSQPTGNTDVIGLNGQGIRAVSRTQVRDGLLGVIEWQPSDRFHTVVDIYYSKFDQREVRRGLEYFSTSDTPDGTRFLNPVITEVGGTRLNLQGIATNVTPTGISLYNVRRDNLFAIGSNTSYKLTDHATVTLDLGYSTVKRRELVQELYLGYAPIRTFDQIGFDVSLTGRSQYSPGLDYTDANRVQLGDPAAWGGWGHDGAIRFPEVEDRLYTADLRFEQNLKDSALGGVFGSVEAGFHYNDRQKSRQVDEFDLFLRNGRANVPVAAEYLIAPSSLSFAGINGILSFDPVAVRENYYNRTPIQNSDNYNKNWTISERLYTPFVMAKIDSELGGIHLRGNAGFQYIITDQSSTGFQAPQSGGPIATPPQLTSGGARYSEILPSLNLVAEFASDFTARFAVGRTSARPRIDELRASVTASVDAISRRWNASGGNPALRPWRATSIDLSVEKYFGRSSYVSIAGYYKDLDSYIYPQTVEDYDFTGFPNTSTTVPISNIGTFTRPANGSGGNLKGFEVSGTIDFGILTKALSGIGIIGSFSHTETNIRADGPNSINTIPGLSGDVRNLTAYLELGGFSTRISQRYRSAYRGEVIQLFANRGFTDILADEQVDFQASYAFRSGFLNGATLLFQVNNLTDSPYRTRTASVLSNGQFLPQDYESYGRQFLFGFIYKFGQGKYSTNQQVVR